MLTFKWPEFREAYNTNVYCKITYKKQNGDLSIEYSSNTFVPSVRQLNFQSITTSIINPNYGCTNPITYNLNTYNCTGSFCDAVYSVNQFEITWTAPSGWSQSSISSNGSSVTFIPDASTGGNITATIILPCGYTEIKTYTVYRGTEQPSIPNSNTYTLCNSTGNFPINSICGSISYTYTIIGSSGITFSANGLQTITTTSTAPIINLSGSSTAFVYKVKANFINNISSSEISADLYYGTPPIDFVSFLNPSSGEGYWCSSAYGNTFALSPSLPNVSYEANLLSWPSLTLYKTSVNPAPGSDPFGYVPAGWYVFQIRVTNVCGTSTWYQTEVEYVDCDNNFRTVESFQITASPNPATTHLNIVIQNETPPVTKLSKTEKVVFSLYNKEKSELVRTWKFVNKANKFNLNIQGITGGNYILIVNKGKFHNTKQIIIR